ncbi:hypothetical protein G3I21_24210, partial [Streptomyces bauhiniae]|nr:hypothetical protein [Streptomyces bauhiniae]
MKWTRPWRTARLPGVLPALTAVAALLLLVTGSERAVRARPAHPAPSTAP